MGSNHLSSFPMKKLSRPGLTDLSLSVLYDSSDAPPKDGWTDNAVSVQLELRNDLILFGSWDVAVRLGGKRLRPLEPWSETVVYSENDCDYLEIDLPLEQDYRLQRHFLLDVAHRILILADSVFWDGDGKRKPKTLEYESTLLYSPTLRAKEANGATELTFFSENSTGKAAGKSTGKTATATKATPLFRMLPLDLPEWKNEATDASQVLTDQSNLVLRKQTESRGFFLPLFFDLDAKRLGKPYTWRRLTVGENMTKVADDQAVGFRVQLGTEQYLLYRSLTDLTNRTVLGHNLIDDFCFGRFNIDSGVESLVAVQQEIE